jgi:glycosyltransferase involved in cell wall biosynthesis
MSTQIPLVSVVMITYAHEAFIKEAIEGVLMQECDFEVELIVANDCSPDNTDFVINEILKSHPRADWIKYTNQENNKGMMPNFIWALEQCQGKYIALCEGDDYWIDPYKLQKQVDFLEENHKYSIHSSNAYLQRVNGLKLEPAITELRKSSFEFFDFIHTNYFITCTVMFRKDNINYFNMPNSVKYGDWFLYLWLLKNGDKAYHSPDIFSVYRIHSGGVYSSLSENDKLKNEIEHINLFHKYFNIKTKSQITNAKLNSLHTKIIKQYIIIGDYLSVILWFYKHLFNFNLKFSSKTYINFLARKIKLTKFNL